MCMVNEDRSYTWKGAGGPFTLTIDPGVFQPSSTSRVLGDAMRVREGDTVLDAGCGSGVLSFVAARLGAGRVYGTDISAASVACATRNAERLGLSGITEFRCGSLFEPVPDVRADVVIADVSGIPDVVAEATGWFPDGHGGGPTGAELPVAMLGGIADHMATGGQAYLPTGSIQNEPRAGRRVERAVRRHRPRGRRRVGRPPLRGGSRRRRAGLRHGHLPVVGAVRDEQR